MLIYGTAWKEEATQRCVEDALEAGFRAIDTANQRKHYYEAGVGAALKKWLSEGRIGRGGLFIQTKFTSIGGQDRRLPYDPEAPLETQVRQSFTSSLEHLHTDYLDSYVLHGPTFAYGVADEDWKIWRAMEKLADEGKARALGVSNVSLEQLREFFEGARIKPKYVQNRCFARTGWDFEVRRFCHENGIAYQGFSLLTANPAVFRDPRFAALIDRVGCTPAQAIFRFALQIGILPLTGTTDPAHMTEDLRSTEFELSPEDVQLLERIALNNPGDRG